MELVEKIKTHISCSIFFFSRKSCRLWDNAKKKKIDPKQGTKNATHALCMLDNYGYTHTERVHVILIALPRQQWFANAPQCHVIRTLSLHLHVRACGTISNLWSFNGLSGYNFHRYFWQKQLKTVTCHMPHVNSICSNLFPTPLLSLIFALQYTRVPWATQALNLQTEGHDLFVALTSISDTAWRTVKLSPRVCTSSCKAKLVKILIFLLGTLQ